jgi:hypothetical protein
MAKRDPVVERPADRRHTAIVLVSVVDRRILPALRFVSRLPDTDVRALHVSVDAAETRRLAGDWMELGLTWLPLHVNDASAEALGDSLRAAVGQQSASARHVTVVVPELDFDRWWHPLLHRRSARRIAHLLQPLPGVTAVIVPYAASLPSRPHRTDRTDGARRVDPGRAAQHFSVRSKGVRGRKVE